MRSEKDIYYPGWDLLEELLNRVFGIKELYDVTRWGDGKPGSFTCNIPVESVQYFKKISVSESDLEDCEDEDDTYRACIGCNSECLILELAGEDTEIIDMTPDTYRIKRLMQDIINTDPIQNAIKANHEKLGTLEKLIYLLKVEFGTKNEKYNNRTEEGFITVDMDIKQLENWIGEHQRDDEVMVLARLDKIVFLHYPSSGTAELSNGNRRTIYDLLKTMEKLPHPVRWAISQYNRIVRSTDAIDQEEQEEEHSD